MYVFPLLFARGFRASVCSLIVLGFAPLSSESTSFSYSAAQSCSIPALYLLTVGHKFPPNSIFWGEKNLQSGAVFKSRQLLPFRYVFRWGVKRNICKFPVDLFDLKSFVTSTVLSPLWLTGQKNSVSVTVRGVLLLVREGIDYVERAEIFGDVIIAASWNCWKQLEIRIESKSFRRGVQR